MSKVNESINRAIIESVGEHGAECHRTGPVEEDIGLAELGQTEGGSECRRMHAHRHAWT